MKSNLSKTRSEVFGVRRRKPKGNLLVEMLVAVAVSAALIGALVQSMAQTHTFSSDAQGQVMAAAISQEIVDHCRSVPFNSLLAMAGTHNIQVTANGSVAGDALFPRPLLQDTQFNYDTTVNNYPAIGSTGIFQAQNNSVTVQVVQMTATRVQVNITVNWTDNSGGHIYNSSTVVARYGINS